MFSMINEMLKTYTREQFTYQIKNKKIKRTFCLFQNYYQKDTFRFIYTSKDLSTHRKQDMVRYGTNGKLKFSS